MLTHLPRQANKGHGAALTLAANDVVVQDVVGLTFAAKLVDEP